MGGGQQCRAAWLTVVVETARFTDLPEIAVIEQRAYSDPWAPSSFQSLAEHPAVHFVVAREHPGGPVVGYAIAWNAGGDGGEGELANLAVAPDCRRRGVGRALLASVLADATSRGTSALFLEVRESNAAARKLYSEQGFEEVGRRRRYYRSPEEDALILRCTLKR